MRVPALLFLSVLATQAATPVVPEAQGFGARSQGGTGGRVLMVTRLDDDIDHPQPGSLRWALTQRGPRIIKFSIAGNIMLKDQVVVREPYVTVDGLEAPGMGICIAGGCLKFSETHDVIVRQVRLRLGDTNTLAKNKAAGLKRPHNSDGLDCVTLEDSQNILFDHCSLSWSCDEIFGITRCRNVTIQWCIMSEPLANPSVHPYGDDHACPVNASASTLSIHHCLFAHFVMRGPQFECNDLRDEDDYTVKMEAVNNVIFDYAHSGARYSCGVEKGQGIGKDRWFQFQLLSNLFLNKNAAKPEIEAITKHGYISGARVSISGNEAGTRWWSPRARVRDEGKSPHQSSRLGRAEDSVHAFIGDAKQSLVGDHSKFASQIRASSLFAAPVPVQKDSAHDAAERVLIEAGCSPHRDSIDQRIIRDVQNMRCGKVVPSQERVGGLVKLR